MISITQSMSLIRQILQQTFNTTVLIIDAEDRLRLLLQTTRYSQEHINEFMRLQLAVMTRPSSATVTRTEKTGIQPSS